VSNKGFTLLELLVIIAIVGTLATVSFLSLGGSIAGYRFKSAVREVYSDMQMARLGAIKGGTDWALCFSADGTFSSYTIRDDSGTDRTLCTADDPKPYRKSVDSASIHSEVTYVENFSGSKLFFTPQGTSISGNVTLSSDSRSQQVTVNGMTGNIRIQ
jgi:type II secretion system protein H